MNKVFIYKGVCLEALRNLTAAERNGNAFMENIGKEKLLPDEFDYEEFYKEAPRKDIFYCATTNKYYLPLKSDGSKGQLVEYIINPEQLLQNIKYVIVSSCSHPLIVTQLAHEFKGFNEVVSYLPNQNITEHALMFDSEEQAKEALNNQPKWVREQHKVKPIIGYHGFWRLS